MALLIEKTTREGFTVSYWRINPEVSYDCVNKRLSANVVPYVSTATRLADKPPAQFNDPSFQQVRTVTIEGATAEAAIKTGEPRDALYVQLKTHEFFSGAQDDL